MGELLKPRVITREQARQKRDAEIAEARARYGRRIKQIEEQDRLIRQSIQRGEEPKLPVRASSALRNLLATYKTNSFGRLVIDRWPDKSELTPEAASKFTAAEFLAVPNLGHKAIIGLAAWLRFHGYELKP